MGTDAGLDRGKGFIAEKMLHTTGILGGNYKISIADGATVVLRDAVINGTNSSEYNWAGITCLGDATIVL